MTKVYCMICKKNPVVLAILQAFPDTPVCKSCIKAYHNLTTPRGDGE